VATMGRQGCSARQLAGASCARMAPASAAGAAGGGALAAAPGVSQLMAPPCAAHRLGTLADAAHGWAPTTCFPVQVCTAPGPGCPE
jgi:hypothetical protein